MPPAEAWEPPGCSSQPAPLRSRCRSLCSSSSMLCVTPRSTISAQGWRSTRAGAQAKGACLESSSRCALQPSYNQHKAAHSHRQLASLSGVLQQGTQQVPDTSSAQPAAPAASKPVAVGTCAHASIATAAVRADLALCETSPPQQQPLCEVCTAHGTAAGWLAGLTPDLLLPLQAFACLELCLQAHQETNHSEGLRQGERSSHPGLGNTAMQHGWRQQRRLKSMPRHQHICCVQDSAPVSLH